MNFIRLFRTLSRNTGRFWHLTDLRQLCSACRSLKLWMVMRLYGKSGLQSHIRKHCELGKHFEGLVQSDSRFEVLLIMTPMVCCVIHFCRNTSLYILWKNPAVLIATEKYIACCFWFVIYTYGVFWMHRSWHQQHFHSFVFDSSQMSTIQTMGTIWMQRLKKLWTLMEVFWSRIRYACFWADIL